MVFNVFSGHQERRVISRLFLCFSVEVTRVFVFVEAAMLLVLI